MYQFPELSSLLGAKALEVSLAESATSNSLGEMSPPPHSSFFAHP